MKYEKMSTGEKGSGYMSTFWFLIDWVTLLYFCLSSLVFGIAILFLLEKHPRIFVLSTINWTTSNLVKSIWNFIEDSLLFESKEGTIPSLIQLIISIILIPVAWYILVLLKKASESEENNEALPIQIYANDDYQVQYSQNNLAINMPDAAINEEHKKQ